MKSFAGLLQILVVLQVSECFVDLCLCLSHPNEVFNGGESNERLTKSQFLSEHIKSASETHPYLRFFVDLINFSDEFAFGQTLVRFGIKFYIYL